MNSSNSDDVSERARAGRSAAVVRQTDNEILSALVAISNTARTNGADSDQRDESVRWSMSRAGIAAPHDLRTGLIVAAAHRIADLESKLKAAR